MKRDFFLIHLGRCHCRIRRRPLWIGLALCALALILAIWALKSGVRTLTLAEVWSALNGEGARGTALAVSAWRLPRILTALSLGAALGMSGAIFQSLIRNPLGSPDVLGFNTGAHSGALIVMAFWPGQMLLVAGGALGGGLSAALLVYALAWRGGMHGLRLVLVGIGVSAMLVALNQWLIISASLETAMSAALWAAGSLNGMTWSRAWPALTLGPVLIGLASLGARSLQLMEMGDDSAAALGLNVERARRIMMLLGVSLTALATAICGPIAFVALAAPHLAQRLSRGSGLITAALIGAVLLLAADFAGQRLFFPAQLPVGIVTVSTGGLYLLWLLFRESRG